MNTLKKHRFTTIVIGLIVFFLILSLVTSYVKNNQKNNETKVISKIQELKNNNNFSQADNYDETKYAKDSSVYGAIVEYKAGNYERNNQYSQAITELKKLQEYYKSKGNKNLLANIDDRLVDIQKNYDASLIKTKKPQGGNPEIP